MNEITVNPILFIVGFFVASKQAELILYLFLRFIVFILTFPKCFISAVCGGKKHYINFKY